MLFLVSSGYSSHCSSFMRELLQQKLFSSILLSSFFNFLNDFVFYRRFMFLTKLNANYGVPFYCLYPPPPPLFTSRTRGMSVYVQLCRTLCDSMDCSLPGFSVYGILQARILEWVAISYSRGSSPLRDCKLTSILSLASPALAGRFFNTEPSGKPHTRGIHCCNRWTYLDRSSSPKVHSLHLFLPLYILWMYWQMYNDKYLPL